VKAREGFSPNWSIDGLAMAESGSGMVETAQRIQEEISKESFQSFSTPYDKRSVFGIALKSCLHLERMGLVDAQQKGRLKDLILNEDKRVLAAVEVFTLDNDVSEMLDTLLRVLKNASIQ